MNSAYLSLGSNEGDRPQWLDKAITLIAENCGTITARSAIYETAAWGINSQPDFLNMVVNLHTIQDPQALLTAILGIETFLGRHREVKWGPRIIDIDILFFNNEIVNVPRLSIPHPFLHERRFTLAPLNEIAPGYIHPVLHKTVGQLLAECPDKLEVRVYQDLPG